MNFVKVSSAMSTTFHKNGRSVFHQKAILFVYKCIYPNEYANEHADEHANESGGNELFPKGKEMRGRVQRKRWAALKGAVRVIRFCSDQTAIA